MTPHLERLQKARINLLLDEPFFGTLMMQLKPVEDPKIPTFRTNGQSLWYNPAYMDRLDDAQLRTVLAHEVLHPALSHPFRIGARDLKTANIAADYAVNNFLDSYNQDAEKRGTVQPFKWPTKDDGSIDVLLDHNYDNKAFEEIYAELMRKKQGDGKDDPQGQPGAGQGQGQPNAANNSPSPGGEGRGEGGTDPDSASSPGEFTAAAADPAEAREQEAQWNVALKQAALAAKAQGRMPAGMERFITEHLSPKASWKEILRTLLTSAAKDDYTWTRPNRRYASRGIILPSLHVPRMGTIVVALDTSGSIGERELNEFLAEVRCILFDCRPEKLIVVQCDAAIHEWTEHDDPFDELQIQMKGGGGTDFRPVFDRIEAELACEPPAALVYLTDLDGSAPDQAPAYPVIWACNNDHQGPFGETVNIK